MNTLKCCKKVYSIMKSYKMQFFIRTSLILLPLLLIIKDILS